MILNNEPQNDIPENGETGRVIRKSTGAYSVETDDGIIECSISSTLRKHLLYPTADPNSLPRRVVEVADIRQLDPVAIGDEVSFQPSGTTGGMITDVLPRRNIVNRRAAGPKPLEQVMAANVDQIIGVFAVMHPKLRWDMLDRFIAGSEALEIPFVLCVTKMDLRVDDDTITKLRMYEELGYQVLFTSIISGEELDTFKDVLRNKVSVLAGESAVGKTSLLNAIQPGLGLKVRELGKGKKGGDKGKHTTTHLEMHMLDIGGGVIDTPGMREFGLWKKEKLNIAFLYREMRPYLDDCKFGADCSHTHEPGCAIKLALEDGKIAQSRYKSYTRLLR